MCAAPSGPFSPHCTASGRAGERRTHNQLTGWRRRRKRPSCGLFSVPLDLHQIRPDSWASERAKLDLQPLERRLGCWASNSLSRSRPAGRAPAQQSGASKLILSMAAPVLKRDLVARDRRGGHSRPARIHAGIFRPRRLIDTRPLRAADRPQRCAAPGAGRQSIRPRAKTRTRHGRLWWPEAAASGPQVARIQRARQLDTCV